MRIGGACYMQDAGERSEGPVTEDQSPVFEWDEPKRRINLEKHGLDFRDADLVFAGQHLVEDAAFVGGEVRKKAIGLIGGKHVALVFTRRGAILRVISLRRARQDEQRRHSALHG